jgi:hypothetical protein
LSDYGFVGWGYESRTTSWAEGACGGLLLISGPIACEKRRTCEVTTKDPNLMTSVVSGMAGVSDCCPSSCNFTGLRAAFERRKDCIAK